jgi:2-polyprenyl-3-methyl-5-hydroxy-6-metoxy-1,4-benzoquinol methylase
VKKRAGKRRMADQANGLLSSWLRKQRIKIATPYIEGKVLDYGCGVGILSEECLPQNYFGVDIDRESLSIARQKYPAYLFATEIPEKVQFDTIILLAVIEHIKAPERFLAGMKDNLNKKGRIILTTPHPRTDKIYYIGSRLGVFSSQADEEHEKLIDYEMMHIISSNAGFEISIYRRFLLGANQLFVLSSKAMA